jgi:HTH-type transcriptional regulator/antitoxin MqsA
MKCPCCGAAELIHDTRDMPCTYKGETTTIPAVTGGRINNEVRTI